MNFPKTLDRPGNMRYNTDRKRKEIKKMNANEIREKIEKVEFRIFCEECADFLDWGAWHKLKAELADLKRQLKEMES